MKKLMAATLVGALMAVALPAKAEVLKNFKTSGEVAVSGVMAQNAQTLSPVTGSYNDSYRNTLSRIIYGMSFDLLDDLHANLTLTKNDRYYGDAAQNLAGIENTVYVQEANVVLDKLFGLQAKIGRQFYGDEKDMVIYYGPTHGTEKLDVSALDAMRFDWNTDKNALQVVWAKAARGTVYTDGDTAILGARDMYKFNDMLNVGGYVYNRRIGQTQDVTAVTAPNMSSDNLYVFGAKATGKVSGVDYYAEAAGNLGHNHNVGSIGTPGNDADYNGYAFLAKAAYNLKVDAVGAINPRAQLFYGSGNQEGTNSHVTDGMKNSNFTAIHPDLRMGLIYGNADGGSFNSANYAQPASLANRNIINVGVDYTPEKLAKLTASLDYFMFGVNTTSVSAKDLGTEADLGLAYKYAENVTLGLTGGIFWGGSYYGKKLGTDGITLNPQAPAYMAMSNITVKF
ncbi:MAG: alginate export family protein [Elusimicrobiales bacterium]